MLNDHDPFLTEMLDRRRERLERGPYHSPTLDQVEGSLLRLFAEQGSPNSRIEDLARMAGGASKEQFVFRRIDGATGEGERLVLRMDPTEGVLETSRERECEILDAMNGIVPVPEVRFRDLDGSILGGTGMVTTFRPGVTKPASSGSGVTGLGTAFSPEWRAKLSPEFVELLKGIHAFDFRASPLPHFGIPDQHPQQAALWRVNLWARVWREDASSASPIFALAEAWLRENLPSCDELVLLHGDFRTGNYLFDEATGRITCILDWEISHIGDHHEDLAWSLVRIFGSRAEDGTYLCSSLMPVDEFIERYEAATGR